MKIFDILECVVSIGSVDQKKIHASFCDHRYIQIAVFSSDNIQHAGKGIAVYIVYFTAHVNV